MDPSSHLWFHGLVTRENAEKALLRCSTVDGTFLMRESASKVGNYVLSLVHKRKVVHYQVNKNSDRIGIDGGPTFAGVVELIEYYKCNQDRLLTKLTTPCNRAEAVKLEIYKDVTHADLEEATRKVLFTCGVEDEDAVKHYKGQFQHVIGSILHKEQPWFHGIIPREEAENRLKEKGLKSGMFLFRERGSPRGTFALVLCHDNKPYNYLFERNAHGQLSIRQGRLFDNLMGVVSYYSQNCEGLWTTLKEPCDVKNFQYRPRKEIDARNVLLNAYIQDALKKEVLRLPDDLKKYKKLPVPGRDGLPLSSSSSRGDSMISRASMSGREAVSPPKRELPPVPGSDTWKTEKIYDTAKLIQTEGYLRQTQEATPMHLDANRLKMSDVLGSGNFGSVMKGVYLAEKGRKIQVAVKTLKEEDMPNQKAEVLAEANIMAKLDHPHIVRLIGITQSPGLMIVMEIAPLGPLHKFLKKNTHIKIVNILILMLQVNEGMDYLESQRFVHRDLAARNVLVVSEEFVKISDFGMSRATGAGNEYYRAERAGKWPLKWYAPECIYYHKFSSKGDVWSYGVTLWEALTYGKKPFQGLKGPQIVEGLEQGKRLEKPMGCPDDVYMLMMRCWEFNPDHRPTFNEIGSILHEILQKPIEGHKYANDDPNDCPEGVV